MIVSPVDVLKNFKILLRSPTARWPLAKTANPYTGPDAGFVIMGLVSLLVCIVIVAKEPLARFPFGNTANEYTP
jgi:hypothetical protein